MMVDDAAGILASRHRKLGFVKRAMLRSIAPEFMDAAEDLDRAVARSRQRSKPGLVSRLVGAH